jgi:hypothetical protein
VHGDKWHRRLGLSDADRDRAVADFYGGLFSAYAAKRGKSRWGDKTPFHAWHLERAIRLYPEGIVVAIVRHPAAVAVSMRRRFRRAIPSGAVHWTRNTRQLLHEADALGDRFVMIRYEDLVIDPETVMRALLDRIGEEWAPEVLAHHTVHEASEAVGFTRTDRAIDTASLHSWESQLQGAALAELTERTGPLARFLGYDPESAVPPDPIDAEGVILDGVAISARKREDPDIDWSAPEPLPKDLPMRPRRKRRERPDAAADAPVRATVEATARSRLSPQTRKRIHEIRRSRPWLDRLFGPR